MPKVANAPAPAKRDLEAELTDEMAACYADPLRFVMVAYPWPVNGESGPDDWQRDALIELGDAVKARPFDGVNPVDPIRFAVSSGHGIGKSALYAWITDWLMSTRRDARGTITANTNDQLEKKTWAAIREWTSRCITAHWFEINSAIMYRKGHRATWFCAPQSCAEENSEAFAGQHVKSSTSFYLFDEASAVPKKIWEVAEGGLTDGAPIICVAGNATRNTGAFYEVVFGDKSDRWQAHVIDSRTCRLPNKKLIEEWRTDYGEESDFFRVRVRGLAPQTSELQFIDPALVVAAEQRPTLVMGDEPLIAGVDVSGGGAAWTVCRFRRGTDARTLEPIRIPGAQSKVEDRQRIVAVLAERLKDETPERKLAAMFVDGAFGAPLVERLHALGYQNVYEVNFGGPSPNPHQANQRAYQWNAMKEWLPRASLPKDDRWLPTDLSGPGFHLNNKHQLVLESKESMLKRNMRSPDDGDALSLTFAQPVAMALGHVPAPYRPSSTWG